jgi:hypothetical protein
MRAFWSRRNDEEAERYRARTVDRLRGLASTEDVDDGSVLPEDLRARIDRLTADTELDATQQQGTG